MSSPQHEFDQLRADVQSEAWEIRRNIGEYFKAVLPPGHVQLSRAQVAQMVDALLNPEASAKQKAIAKKLVEYQFDLAERGRDPKIGPPLPPAPGVSGG